MLMAAAGCVALGAIGGGAITLLYFPVITPSTQGFIRITALDSLISRDLH
jgi:hypothetical protein